MSGWSHGYNVSSGYTYGFYRETAPAWIDLALSLRGLETPRRRGGEAFRYLELGSGQGLGLCLLAAANPEGEFLGIDFSPEHTAHARALAGDMGLTNVEFVEGDFAALGQQWPPSFGQHDYVVMHGIYSWVPEAIRRSLVAILSASMAPGAALYVSYNSMPGWASTLPFQHVLRRLHEEGGRSGMAAIQAGRALFAKMDAAGSGVTQALPALKQRIENTRNQPEAYLMQEYLHENWHPMWCSKVMDELAGAKLDLAATATIAENLLPQILPAALRDVLAGHDQPRLREDLTDCLINQTFRRDIYARGGRRRFVGDTGWAEEYRVWRINPAAAADLIEIKTGFGSLTLPKAEVEPLLEAVGEGSRSLAQLCALPFAKKNPAQAMQNLVLLIHAGWLNCGRQSNAGAEASSAGNAAIASAVARGAPYRHLAATKIGSAIAASDSEMLLLNAYLGEPEGFAGNAGKALQDNLGRLGRKLGKDGTALTGEAEAAEIARLVATFEAETLPRWRRIGVVG